MTLFKDYTDFSNVCFQERLQREAREREEDLAALEEDVPEGSDPSEQWYVRKCLS